MTQLLIIVAILALGGVAAAGWSLFGLAGALRKRVSGGSSAPQLEAPPEWARKALEIEAREVNGGDARTISWREGEDLLRYPARLAGLSQQLEDSHSAVQEQQAHLRARREEVAAKEGRQGLVARYEADGELLRQRAAGMRRVLTLVWRTRATLRLRAHVAITARHRPELQGLPEGEVAVPDLQLAAQAYESAAERVRRFVLLVDRRASELEAAVPSLSSLAEPGEGDRKQVEEELSRARATYQELRDRMDRLADTLAYLADRCQTRHVVVDTPAGVDEDPGGAQVFEELNAALVSLQDLSELGDRHLADAAMDNLVEDISQLERAGLEAQAEADANLEVARLLEQFPA